MSRYEMAFVALGTLLLLSVPSHGQPIAAEPLGVTKLTGTIRETPDGKLVITPDSQHLPPIPLTQASQVPFGVLQMPIRAELEKTQDGTKIKDFKLDALARLEDLSAKTSSAGLRRAIDHLQALDRELRIPGAMSTGVREQLLQKAQSELISAHDALDQSVESKKLIAREFSSINRIKQDIIDKARYGHDDRYYPEVYKTIFANSKGSLALVDNGTQQAFCSGVLIAQKIILTALHCFKTKLIGETTAVFNYEVDIAGHPLEQDKYPIHEFIARGKVIEIPDAPQTPQLDFALLSLSPNKSGKLPGDIWPPQCITDLRVQKDDPLYIIGHPQGGVRTVHDNTFVRFPFTATQDEYDTLRLLVEAEAIDRGVAGSELTNSFSRSYRKTVIQSTNETIYQNFSEKFDFQPTIGVDSDTFEGNSGSPTYNRRSNYVIGILIKGAADRSQSYVPGWKSHEAILPTTKIMEQLDSSLPKWREFDGVCTK